MTTPTAAEWEKALGFLHRVQQHLLSRPNTYTRLPEASEWLVGEFALVLADARTAALEQERVDIQAKVREYALHYPQSSDGRNTFVLLGEWIEDRALAKEPT